MGIGLTVAQQIRNGWSEAELRNQLARIQQNTEQPPQVTVNVPKPPVPVEHSHIDWMQPAPLKSMVTGKVIEPLAPFYDGEVPKVNLGFHNAGEFPVLTETMKAIIVVAPLREAGEAFRNHKKEVLASKGLRSGVLNPHEPGNAYNTFAGSPLDHDQVIGLTHGKDVLCAIGLVIWKDKSGRYETDFSEFLSAELPDEGFNWHITTDNDVERKLK